MEIKREIKFRAWDKKKKKMFYDVGVMNNKVVMYESGPFGELLFYDDLLPMQYIGKGKNNIEIYEKDIVKTPLGKIVEIYWDNDTNEFRWEGKQYYTAGGKITELEELEVVGNKLENPELLEGKT